ncbi:MAG TPA: hypothetical protein VFO55_07095 [Gemmatimonadaceae bacterium]|nr:hypothetical protein [Gemmatimonadaceae bacterium]
MPKKPGRGPKKNRRGPGGGGSGSGGGAGPRPGGRGRDGRGKRGPGGPGGRGKAPRKSDYFMQPGRRGVFIVLRRPIGNRIHAKVCGTMPSRIHAKMLIDSLQRAESVVKDLFMEATDDGIEALEAILTATCEDVLRRGPKVEPRPQMTAAEEAADDAAAAAAAETANDDDPYADDDTDEVSPPS